MHPGSPPRRTCHPQQSRALHKQPFPLRSGGGPKPTPPSAPRSRLIKEVPRSSAANFRHYKSALLILLLHILLLFPSSASRSSSGQIQPSEDWAGRSPSQLRPPRLPSVLAISAPKTEGGIVGSRTGSAAHRGGLSGVQGARCREVGAEVLQQPLGQNRSRSLLFPLCCPHSSARPPGSCQQ